MTLLKVEVATPDGAQLASGVEALRMLAESITIDCDELEAIANDNLAKVKVQISTLDKQHDELKRPILEAGRKVDALFLPLIRQLQAVEQVYKGKLGARVLEKRRIAAEEQRRRDEAAAAERRRLEQEAAERERRADEDRRRAEQEAAERRRIEEAAAAERRRQEEAAAADLRRKADAEAAEQRRRAEEAAAAGHAEEARRLAEQAERDAALAREREDQARREAAERAEREQREARDREERQRREAEEAAARERAESATLRVASMVVTAAPVEQPKAPENIGVRMEWCAEGVDLMTVLREIVEGNAPMTLVMFDEKAISRTAKALGEGFKVPGIKTYQRPIVSQRKRAA